MRSFAERTHVLVALIVAATIAATSMVLAQGNRGAALFADARTLEQTLRKEIGAYRPGAPASSLIRRARILVGTYEDIARLFPEGGYGDKALWQGAILAADVYDVFKDAADRSTAVRLSESLRTKYASSALVTQAERRVRSLAPPEPASAAEAPTASQDEPVPTSVSTKAVTPAPVLARPTPAAPATGINVLQGIHREVLPDVLRITLEMDREVPFHEERLDGPPRVFVDLPNTRAASSVQDARMAFDDDVVRQIRVGRQLNRRVRVVLDLNDAPRHSVYTRYKPFRIVIDFERTLSAAAPPPADDPGDLVQPRAKKLDLLAGKATTPSVVAPPVLAIPTRTPPPAELVISVPSTVATRPGGLTFSRQLGLGIGRIVIDPGHGGYDPGATENGITESELVLDVALRLELILQKAGDVEVVLTRRSNVFVPLEERPALATRQEADLYLSIHANASSDRTVRGVETYILNFAPNAQSEAVAARENRGSARTMRSLPDIVKAIALNNKVDESRALARQVQSTLVEKLSKGNRVVRNLGVKQAPFAVLVGAEMPSILAEIAFITNKQDAALVKTAVYRQQVAEALADGILRYQRRLKPSQVTATSK